MKKLIISISLLGFIAAGFAQSRVVYTNLNRYNSKPNNKLVIDLRGMHDFTVVVDNNLQYQSSGGAVNISSLSNGNHKILVYEDRKGFLGMGKQRQRAIFNSTVRLKPGVETSVMVNHSGQADVNEKLLYGYYNGNNDNRRNDHPEIRN